MSRSFRKGRHPGNIARAQQSWSCDHLSPIRNTGKVNRHLLQRLKKRRRCAQSLRKAGRSVRGEFYAIEGAQGVWLAGRPSSAAWGLHYRSWAELARERPGLRPCGTRKSDDPFGPVETYIVLRPIADLEAAPSP